MTLQIITSVVLEKLNGDRITKSDFNDTKSAVLFLDKEIRKNEFNQGSIIVSITKG